MAKNACLHKDFTIIAFFSPYIGDANELFSEILLVRCDKCYRVITIRGEQVESEWS